MAFVGRADPVDGTLDVVLHHDRGKGVEIVVVGGQEHGRHPFQPCPGVGGRGQQIAPGQLDPRILDPSPLLVEPRPHQHVESGGAQGAPHVDHPWLAAHQEDACARGLDDGQPPGHRGRGQRVQQDGSHDHQEGDREDLGGAALPSVDEAGGERRRRGGRDDAARSHPPDERPFSLGQARTCRRGEGDKGTHHQDEDRDEGETGEQHGDQGGRGDGRGDGDEQQADDQLDQGLEEGPASRHVEAAEVGDGQSRDDRGDESRVVPDDVTTCGNGDDGRELRQSAQRFPQPQDAQRPPQQRRSHRPADQADGEADAELAQLVAAADVDTVGRGDGVEGQSAENAADRVGQCSFPDEDASDLVVGPHVVEQGTDDRRSRDDEDHSEHRGHPEWHVEQGGSHRAGDKEGNQHSEQQQSAHDPSRAAFQVAQVETQTGVVEDHRHGQGHQAGEVRPHQLGGMDDIGEGAGGESGRQQHDQGGNAQLARQDL